MNRYCILAVPALALSLLCGCSSNEWKVKGNISGAQGETIVLEAANNGLWYALDSARIGDNGKFSFARPPVGYPDIFRLNLQGKCVYFPIDSVETVTVTADAGNLEHDYLLKGSLLAEMVMETDHKIMRAAAEKGEAALASDSILKRELSETILADESGLVAYYIINKRVGNTQLFNPADRRDLRMIGAVANAFAQKRPADPRTEYLRQYYLGNKRLNNADIERGDTLFVSETTLFDIRLYDNAGKLHSLQEVASKGNVVVLNFTIYDADESPAFNRSLAKVYSARHSAGLEIFQVSADEDEFTWKQSAKNLPWITVYNSATDGPGYLKSYNVTVLPTTYVIDRSGELVERVDDITLLGKVLDKYM